MYVILFFFFWFSVQNEKEKKNVKLSQINQNPLFALLKQQRLRTHFFSAEVFLMTQSVLFVSLESLKLLSSFINENSFSSKKIKCLCLKMSKQIVRGFLSFIFPNAFAQKHSPSSKAIHLNSSRTSHFWNKTTFLGKAQQKPKPTPISSGY